jgi:hypothetical protein
VAESAKQAVQLKPERSEERALEEPPGDKPVEQEQASIESIKPPEEIIPADEVTDFEPEPAIETTGEPETTAPAERELKDQTPEPEAPAPIEQGTEPSELASEQIDAQSDIAAGQPSPAMAQLEPDVSKPIPAELEYESEPMDATQEEIKPSTEIAADPIETPAGPVEAEIGSEEEPQLPVDSEEEHAESQPLPLEEAWPVQPVEPTTKADVAREPAVEPGPAVPQVDDGDLPTLIVQREVVEDDSSVEELRSAVDKVAPGKTTDSSIELVPPRRPRPVQAPAKPQIEETESHEPPSEPVQMHIDEATSPTLTPEIDQPDVDIQIAHLKTPALDQPADRRMVQTDIGALPRDFWDYLGETTPETTASQQYSDSSSASVAVDTVQRQEAATDTMDPVTEESAATQLVGLDMAWPMIQRQPEDVQTEAEPAATEDETPEAEGGDSGEVDIQALAREILPIIKRKLSVEWERNRGRY